MSGDEPTYLITGATGFLGRHVLQALKKILPRARVAILVRDASSWESQSWRAEAGEVEVITGSLFRVDDWKDDARLAGLRGIFHLAAVVRHSRVGEDEMIRTNVEGTKNIVRLAAERKCRMIFASTSGAVGCSTDPNYAPYEDAPHCDAVVAGWPYYASKIRAEKESRALATELGVELIFFRPPVILGPGDHRFRSTSNLLRLFRGRLPFILAGEMHFVDVRDVAEAMVRAMTHPAPKAVYHLRGKVSTLDEFFRASAKEAGIEPKWKTLPTRLLWYAAKLNQASGRRLHMLPDPVVIEMASHHWGLGSRYAEVDLGYRSRAPEETLRDTMTWIRANYNA